MKQLPRTITKAEIVRLYGNQHNSLVVLTEVKSIQEKLGISKFKNILDDAVKIEFIRLFGLPTGYENNELKI